MNESILKAIVKLYSVLELDGEGIMDDIKNGYITENDTRSGRTVLWYLDESRNVAIYIDTLEELTEEEKEKELL